jgi:hypothetical protein
LSKDWKVNKCTNLQEKLNQEAKTGYGYLDLRDIDLDFKLNWQNVLLAYTYYDFPIRF